MNDFNDRQREYLRQYGLTEEEITSGKTDPAHRLEIANRAGKDEPAEEEPEVETVEETDAQKAYRGNRTREQITSAVDIENYEALGGAGLPQKDRNRSARRSLQASAGSSRHRRSSHPI